MSGNSKTIAVTGPSKRLRFGWWATRLQLWRVGLSAVYVHPKGPELPDNMAGLIVGGGDDIDPQHYGRSGTAGANYDAARDQLELSILNQYLSTDLPILGICRGAQLMNVALGGNLHQDIRPKRKLTPNRNSAFPIKIAELVKNSRLSQIMGKPSIRINSLHSQAVDQVGDGLIAVAHDADGFIQATESTEHPFRIGVQWHPEYLLFEGQQKKLFQAFAQASDAYTPAPNSVHPSR